MATIVERSAVFGIHRTTKATKNVLKKAALHLNQRNCRWQQRCPSARAIQHLYHGHNREGPL